MNTEDGMEDSETIRILVGAAVSDHRLLARSLCRPIQKWAKDLGLKVEFTLVVGIPECIEAFVSTAPRYALFTGMSRWTLEQLAMLSALRTDRVDWAITTGGVLGRDKAAMLNSLQVDVFELPDYDGLRKHFVKVAA